MMQPRDTIAAVATPPGSGGVGIVRVSGADCKRVAEALAGKLPQPRLASYRPFHDQDGSVIDTGILLYFPAPHSFTGEDVLEFQAHGGAVILDLLLQRILDLGIRPARAGEFTERAFLNGKIDLAQAEAVADLIEARTVSAARLAGRTLQGVFSERVHALVEQLIELRIYVESAIDFPEEEIDFLSDGRVANDLKTLTEQLAQLIQSANTGRLLRDGMTLVIAGRPNAGKSSLLNQLSGEERAIVTDIPGTTRDLLREQIQIDGLPLHIIDTAGIRDSEDPVEIEGIRRARQEIEQADRILWIFDHQTDPQHLELDRATLPAGVPLTLVRNKIDLTELAPSIKSNNGITELALSAKSGAGMELLRQHLKQSVGFGESSEGEFMARRRHLDALQRAATALERGNQQFKQFTAGEILAEELRQAQQALNEITGEFCADDLLGRIFSSFCIGK
ncbi:tRNA uridine-5-carboxymethylaminomethyl(34) synthesis GTPase MnmE [Candidatus Endoriftia persephone]|jgi:tRNA modification GTPase|uniref:tRNA modification GTPase MnmE n=1 Tax=endosymbiont of Tevnia jerichonana (vent Tica) TaxID=1049564 RepID=G2FGH3_9GAMM|nr:tRNA uridine-5-carboxymethylaminomethyl(34) synthesis GTPase MnmE [Candidatus Endoriftia persephone]EGW54084.1 tRNA modification GTPase MnmE [endosymbiont of Tevnia jerichonana (vent Tica)]